MVCTGCGRGPHCGPGPDLHLAIMEKSPPSAASQSPPGQLLDTLVRRLPAESSGGLLSKGHPLSATGIAQVVEILWQLRGKAGRHQVEGARVGLSHVVGGYVAGLESAAVSVHIFKA